MRAAAKIPCCLFVCLLILSPTFAAAENVHRRAAVRSITADELKLHVDVLADDSFEGREAGSRGGHAAAGYLREQFEKHGLAGGGTSGSYFQSFGNGYRNILGILPGSDPQLRDQFVVVGGHYDHVGYGNQGNSFGPFGYVHNGADDNASGVAAILEILDAIAVLPKAPRRSILFALWDGEEKGLLGSKHWVENPTVALASVVLATNVDMIGRLRNQRLEVYGSRSAAGLRRVLSEMNLDSDLSLDFTWEMKPNSDHYSFYSSRVPVLMFHTGLHDDYHRPSDDAHLVNIDGMRQVTRFLFNTVYELADRSARADFRMASELETPSSQQELEQPIGPPPPRLGVRWEPENDEQTGLLLSEVEPDSPADQAGLAVGDRIVRFSGQEIRDAATFRRQVLTSGSPVPIVARRAEEEEPLEVSVELAGRPVRIGISWREDESEPGTVIVSRVIYGSPARDAGLRARDRIYEIDGRGFQSTKELLHLFTTLPSPIRLLIEREGKIQTLELQVANPQS